MEKEELEKLADFKEWKTKALAYVDNLQRTSQRYGHGNYIEDLLSYIQENVVYQLKLAAIIQPKEVEQNEWISAIENPPDIGEEVLIYNTEGATLTGKLMMNGWIASFADGRKFMGELTATHWQPLPLPPTKQK